MIDMTYDPRAGLEVMRYHTWRTIRQQSVGEHTSQVLRILLTIWPTCPGSVLNYVVHHDIDEMCGDIPYPFKKDIAGLGDSMRAAGRAVRQEMSKNFSNMGHIFNDLGEGDKKIFKLAENIEMWEYALTELNMGNQYAQIIAKRMGDAIDANLNEVGAFNKDIYNRAMRYLSERRKQEGYTHGF